MDAKVYVYAYLVLSVLYAGACIQYLNSVTRTASLAKRYRSPEGAVPGLDTEDLRASTQEAVRSVLGVDSAAFACAVIPVAYVAVTGLLGNLLSANARAAGTINPMWLTATVAVVSAHMFFLVRIVSLNSKLRDAETAVLSRSFVSRHVSMLTYYRVFIGVVMLLHLANVVYIVANLGTVVATPYVM